MKLNKKKGFTIVELVIVIAVIAILAAVLIPNISKLVKKANASADESLVRNLNTALAMDTEKHATMSDALKAALDNGGYDVAKIVTKDKDNKILWDSVNDCFVYLKKGDEKPTYIPKTSGKYTEAKNYQLFEIVDEIPALADQKYAIYLTGNSNNQKVDVKVGFDAGENANNFNVNYSRTATGEDRQSVIICTNGGTLTVDASNDTVSHYGYSNGVEIKAVYEDSYHEYGKVRGTVSIEEGRFVAESGSEITFVKVAATDLTKIKAIEVKSGAAVIGVTASNADAKTALANKVTGADLYLEGDTKDKAAYAKVGDTVTFYDTLQAALVDNAKVVLLKNVSEDIVVASGSVTINLNGFMVQNNGTANTILVKYGATLTVEGDGIVDNTVHEKAAIFNNGTVLLNGGKYTRSCENGISQIESGGNSYYAIANHGNMTINEGVSVIFDGAYSSLVQNGYYNYDKDYKEGTNAKEPHLTINGGVFSGGCNTLKNDDGGVLVVNGGTFSNMTQNTLLNWNVATINGGIFNCKKITVIANGKYNDTVDKGILTINGGTFNAIGGYGVGWAKNGSSLGTVTKASSVSITAAPGYEWNAEGVLVKSAS